MAGRYYRKLAEHCDKGIGGTKCVAIAGAFSDQKTTFSSRYLNEYIKGTGMAAWRPAVWSIHPYAEAYGNKDQTGRNRTAVTLLLNRTARGSGAPAGRDPAIWLTEFGGRLDVHRKKPSQRGNVAAAANDAEYVLRNIATGLSKRVTRAFYYNWSGDRAFDSGLTKYYTPCPAKPASCQQSLANNPRAKRAELFDLYKGYSNP